MVMQVRRTPTPNNPPTGLAEGQLSVGMADTPPSIWVGVPTSIDPSGVKLATPYLPLTGGTLANPGNLIIDVANTAPVTADGAKLMVTGNGVTTQVPSTSTNYDNIRSNVIATPGSTATNVSGVGAYVRNQQASSGNGQNTVGFYSVNYAEVNNAFVWGVNSVCTDSPVATSGATNSQTGCRLLGYEVDFNVMSTDTEVLGVGVTGGSLAQPKLSNGFVVSPLDFAAAMPWTNGLLTNNGACQTAINIGAMASGGVSVASQPITFNYFDSSGTYQSAQISISDDWFTLEGSVYVSGEIWTNSNVYGVNVTANPNFTINATPDPSLQWARVTAGAPSFAVTTSPLSPPNTVAFQYAPTGPAGGQAVFQNRMIFDGTGVQVPTGINYGGGLTGYFRFHWDGAKPQAYLGTTGIGSLVASPDGSISRLLYATGMGGPINAGMNCYNWDATIFWAVQFSAVSDIRIKDNIRPTEVDALAEILATPVRAFDIKATAVAAMQPTRDPMLGGPPPRPQPPRNQPVAIGLVAQEVQAHIPDMVTVTQQPEGHSPALPSDLHSLSLQNAVPYLIRAIQQLAARVEELEKAA